VFVFCYIFLIAETKKDHMPDVDKFQSNNEWNRSTFKETRQKGCVCSKELFIPYNTSDLMKWFSITAPRKNNFWKYINSINE